MTDADWELFATAFNALLERLRTSQRRVEDLESRVCDLERQLRDHEAESSRPVLSLVGTAERCERIGAGQHTADAETCPLCTGPLGDEHLFHSECAARENAHAEDFAEVSG